MTKWIKSKVVVFFGIGNQFAGMYIADNQEQIKMLEKLVYGFPMHFRVYDEIPRITDCIKSINTYGNVITTEVEDIDGNIKFYDFSTHLSDDDFNNFFAEVEEIFGSS
jgi:hypothetical protein